MAPQQNTRFVIPAVTGFEKDHSRAETIAANARDRRLANEAAVTTVEVAEVVEIPTRRHQGPRPPARYQQDTTAYGAGDHPYAEYDTGDDEPRFQRIPRSRLHKPASRRGARPRGHDD